MAIRVFLVDWLQAWHPQPLCSGSFALNLDISLVSKVQDLTIGCPVSK
jgi:hypothetical protein